MFGKLKKKKKIKTLSHIWYQTWTLIIKWIFYYRNNPAMISSTYRQLTFHLKKKKKMTTFSIILVRCCHHRVTKENSCHSTSKWWVLKFLAFTKTLHKSVEFPGSASQASYIVWVLGYSYSILFSCRIESQCFPRGKKKFHLSPRSLPLDSGILLINILKIKLYSRCETPFVCFKPHGCTNGTETWYRPEWSWFRFENFSWEIKRM